MQKTVGPRKPNGFLYQVCVFLFGLYLRVFRGLHIDRSAVRDKKGPMLIVCNHQSMMDFGAVAAAFLPRRLNFVVSTHFFHGKLLHTMLPVMGCIPKRQFFPDLFSVRQMLRVVKRGGCVAIFPEGQVCSSGQNSEIDPNIGKLAKTLGVPVVNVMLRGNHLAQPKWAGGNAFPARTECKVTELLSAGEVKSLSAEQLAQRILAGVSYDDYEWQRTARTVSRRPRSAEGLEKVLWLCPVCGREHTLSAAGDTISCAACGFAARVDKYGFLARPDGSPAPCDTPSGWFRWQEEQVAKRLADGTLLPFSSKVRFLESAYGSYGDHGYEVTGEGVVTLDRDGLHYEGSRNGAPFTFHVSPAVQWTLTHNAELCAFDVAGDTDEDRDFAFDTEDPRDMMKFIESYSAVRRKWYDKKDPGAAE